MPCGLGSSGSCCSGSGGLCCSGSGGLRVSFLTVKESLDMKNPNIMPIIKSMDILAVSLCGVLVMVIWLYVALVEGSSGDVMSNPSGSFSSNSSKNWHSSLYGTLIVKCWMSWLDRLCSVELHKSSISSENWHVLLDVGLRTIILHASGWLFEVVLGSIAEIVVGWSLFILA